MSQAHRDFGEALGKLLDELEVDVRKISDQYPNITIIAFGEETGAPVSFVANCEREKVARAFASLVKYWADGFPDVPVGGLN